MIITKIPSIRYFYADSLEPARARALRLFKGQNKQMINYDLNFRNTRGSNVTKYEKEREGGIKRENDVVFSLPV